MAEGSFTQTGVAELRAAIDVFPARHTAALRSVAQRSAERMRNDARRRLLAQLKTNARALADGITVKEDAANRQFMVESSPPKGQHPLVTIWNEYGTFKMSARPYMHPAADAEREPYRREMDRVSVAVAQETFGG